jgi:hypothetical protein
MAKFELEEYHRNITEEDFIKDLQSVANKIKKDSLSREEYEKHGRFHPSSVQRKFGSWSDALIRAGLNIRKHQNITKHELIDDLKYVATSLNKISITRDEYNIYGKFSSTTFAKKFGSWFKALEMAGLQKTRNLGVTNEEYFENLEEVWAKLGRQPHYNDMQKPLSKYVGSSYEYRFGTWRKALESFVGYVNTEETDIVEKSNSAENEVEEIEKSYPIESIYKHKTSRNISWRLRFIIMRRDNFKCQKCGRSPATDSKVILHVDHKKAWSRGGESIPENLETLCMECNIGKSNLDI